MKCQLCSEQNKIKTSLSHKSGKAGRNTYDINSRATLATLHAGIGETHLTSNLSVMNIPTMSRASFKSRERETGKCIEAVARVSCENVITQEKNQLMNIGEETDENNDMGWQRRGKGFNSNTIVSPEYVRVFILVALAHAIGLI